MGILGAVFTAVLMAVIMTAAVVEIVQRHRQTQQVHHQHTAPVGKGLVGSVDKHVGGLAGRVGVDGWMREVEAQYPKPRSNADEQLIETERRRLIRELRGLRRTAMWSVPPDEG